MSIIQQGPKSLNLIHKVKEAVEQAQAIESMHGRSFGGHRHHERGKHPMLRLPLPNGYRRVKR